MKDHGTAPVGPHDESPAAAPLAVDALGAGITVALVLTVVQRAVGFLRSIVFCRLLDADQLGLWSLAFSFLLLAAPLAVLGLPGSFGRYVEHYRQRGQLRHFLRRTTTLSVMLALGASIAVAACRRPRAVLIFNDSSQSRLVLLLAGALLVVIAFHFLLDLLLAMRQVRVVSLMQLSSSVVFAGAGITLIGLLSTGAGGVVVAYCAGYAVAGAMAVVVLRRCWRRLPPGVALSHSELWPKLLPFAGWVWVINLLANLFDVADRYMLVHLAPLDARGAQALVGQYHSARILPLLMLSVAGMLSTILLPYLTADWEAGRRGAVGRRLNLAMKMIGLSFTAGGVLLLAAAPWLFGSILGGKYSQGLAVLPWTLTYCVWFSLNMMAQNYLWCGERAGRCGLALAIGLGANVALNALLVPLMGLPGAVLATAAGNALALALVLLLSRRMGLVIERGTVAVSLLPLVMPLGPLPAGAILVGAVWLLWRSGWLLDSEQSSMLGELIADRMNSLPAWITRGKAAST